MDHYCAKHPERKTCSFCNSCKRYFCSEYLTEGGEFYFCNDPACQLGLEKDISRRQDFPSVVPIELLDGTAAFVVTNALETMIVAASTGIVMSIFIIHIYRNKALIFGSLAIVVYLTLSLAMLLIRYFPGSIEDPVLWILPRYARPFLVSVVFYFVLICVIRNKGKRLLRKS